MSYESDNEASLGRFGYTVETLFETESNLKGLLYDVEITSNIKGLHTCIEVSLDTLGCLEDARLASFFGYDAIAY